MKKMDENGMKNIAELFMHMPEKLFKSIFLNDKIIEMQMLSDEEVKFYLSNLRTHIVMAIVMGIQKVRDGVEDKFIERCTKLFEEIVNDESKVDEQLKAILRANKISTKPN